MLNRKNKIEPHYTSSAADLLKETIVNLNMTPANLATDLKLSQKDVLSILNQKTFMNKEIAMKIEDALGISSDLLLNLDNNFKAKRSFNNKI